MWQINNKFKKLTHWYKILLYPYVKNDLFNNKMVCKILFFLNQRQKLDTLSECECVRRYLCEKKINNKNIKIAKKKK